MSDSKDGGGSNGGKDDNGPKNVRNSISKSTISGALGGSQRAGRRWEASESGSFKVVSNSSSSLKAIQKGDINPNDRLTISILPTDSNVPSRSELLADKDRSKRTPYVAIEGDHLGKVAMKAYGKSSAQLESLILRTNPHLEVRRSFSIEHSIDRSYLQSGVAFELPSWNEVDGLS